MGKSPYTKHIEQTHGDTQMNTAQIILSQIKAIDPMATWAWGAKEFVNTGKGLRFKTSGMTPWKGYVHVIYNEGSDLYSVEFSRVRKHQVKVDQVVDDVYAEDLVSIIDQFVG